MNCQPFMRAIIEAAVFFGLSDDQVVESDAAVSQLENIASILKELNRDERAAFQLFIQQLIEQEEAQAGCSQRVEFLRTLTHNLGLD